MIRTTPAHILLIFSGPRDAIGPATVVNMTRLELPRAARKAVLALIFALAWSAAPPGVRGAADKPLGTFKSWSAMSFTEDNKIVCMMWSQPEKAEGNYKKRGEIFVFVTHRPGDNEVNKVSFESGYTFKESSDVQVNIDALKFTLYTDGSTAWGRRAKDDNRMVRAMRAGKAMVVEGTSSRGTLTSDTYSLHGFTAAHNAINKACKKK